MRTLFLTAKKFAIDANASAISLEYFKEALSTLELIDPNVRKLVYEYLSIEPSLTSKVSKESIENVKKHNVVPFDDEVKKFKEYLESNGFAMTAIVSKIFVEKTNSIKKVKENISKLEESLKSQVYGQDQAIEAVCDKIVESSYNIATDTPKAIYFFLGPPATGKTMLSKLIVDQLEGYDAFKIFDMTQYSSSKDGFGLFGLEKGYTDATEGKLTKFVKENPNSVVVFDEIEKTHPDVLSNFLMMLSSGKAEDGFTGEIIDFKNTIVVFTSNLGSELYNNSDFVQLMKENPLEANSTIIDAIGREERIIEGDSRKALSPELLSRLSQGQIVLFNKLPFDALLNITKTKVLEVQANFESIYGIDIEYDTFDSIIALLLLSFAPQVDVRKLKSKLPLVIFDLITDYVRANDSLISRVDFRIDKHSSELLKSELLDLNSEAQIKFLHNIFRKNETFKYKLATNFDSGVLTFTFSDVVRKKLSRSVDFSGEEGLVFTVPSISFKDVAGHAVAKKRLGEVINILKDPKKLDKFNVGAPKGMLLYGVPGTGKTMLAKAFANEADLPFIQTTGTEILNIELMKKIFKKAREYAPAIVFIDEIDAIGTRDGSRFDVIINQFLTELNGFSDSADEMVFVIAATNLKQKIDPAILRSGRIDLHVEIDSLDRAAREFFIDKILEKPISGSFDKEKILTYTAGMTGADLEKVARESVLYVFRHSLENITQDILIEQINIIKHGSRITHKSIDKLMESTAIHEAGHAVVSIVLMPEAKIEQITVVPRGGALGFVSYDQDADLSSLTRQDIKNKLCIAFAGREAQLKEYGEEGFDSGASSDLNMATKYAHYAIATLGMGESTGYINVSNFKEDSLFEKEIEAELKLWLNEAKEKTQILINEHWDKVSALAKLLQEKEIVNEAELITLMT
ncbi:AAA family ATPase [Candidatus Sulfurimonas baltica]|uniref:AAA family ATPase n=1 Tax=Candidatus Sulfurimonas baltica TaxID=2740404 RepID=A0A7S7RP92_9BACT|nr:AAA family ATPase [Candidatus Sulfurimonas baltica]QOY53235.1 AAA family ATPase [Candidatus Sulfurimonas baltica]